MTTFSQTNVLTFCPNLEVEGVCKDKEYAFAWYSVFHYFNLICNMTTFSETKLF